MVEILLLVVVAVLAAHLVGVYQANRILTVSLQTATAEMAGFRKDYAALVDTAVSMRREGFQVMPSIDNEPVGSFGIDGLHDLAVSDIRRAEAMRSTRPEQPEQPERW